MTITCPKSCKESTIYLLGEATREISQIGKQLLAEQKRRIILSIHYTNKVFNSYYQLATILLCFDRCGLLFSLDASGLLCGLWSVVSHRQFDLVHKLVPTVLLLREQCSIGKRLQDNEVPKQHQDGISIVSQMRMKVGRDEGARKENSRARVLFDF